MNFEANHFGTLEHMPPEIHKMNSYSNEKDASTANTFNKTSYFGVQPSETVYKSKQNPNGASSKT